MKLSARSADRVAPLAKFQADYITKEHGGDIDNFWQTIVNRLMSDEWTMEPGHAHTFTRAHFHGSVLGTLYLDPDYMAPKGRNFEVEDRDGTVRYLPVDPDPLKLPGQIIIHNLCRAFGFTEDYIPNYITEMRSQVFFAKSGQRVYEVAPGLAQRLANTDIRGVDCDMVKLPYNSLILRLPPECGFNIEEIIVSEVPAVKFNSRYSEKFVRGQMPFLHTIMSAANVDVAPRSFVFFGSRRGQVDDVVYSVFFLPSGLTVDKVIDLHDSAEAEKEILRITNFCMNVILYLSWPDEGEEFEERMDGDYRAAKARLGTLNGYKKERLKDKLKTMFPDRRIYVGAKVPFLRGAESVSTGTGQSPMVRTLVAGHWKKQPCGPKMMDRKLIRIEPYWRGPIDAPEVNTTHRVV